MELFPALRLGWLNGWLMLGSFYLVFGTMMLVFPRAVVKKLYDFRILGEERACAARYGEPYRQFLKQVPRYLFFV